MRKLRLSVAAAAAMLSVPLHAHAQQPETKVAVPADYREWIYMTSGIDMTYATAKSPHAGPSVFDNVFVNPDAWRTFKQTGTWPDGTTFVLENRMAQQNVSINRGGQTQDQAIYGVELHQKRAGQWTFYTLANDGAEHLISKPAGCYTCHEAHAAVDTTFVQFYPTALPIAKTKNTLSKAYLTELDASPAK